MLIAKLMVNITAFFQITYWIKISGTRKEVTAAKVEEDKSELKQLVSTLNPGGPKYNYFGCMRFNNQ